MTFFSLLSSLLLAVAGPIEKPSSNPAPCTIAVEEIIPYFRSKDTRGPEFQVWVRNVGTATIEYAAFLNAVRLDLDGEILPPMTTFASVEPAGFAPGERGFDFVLLDHHVRLPYLKSGLHTLTYVCGRVRSTPVRFVWDVQAESPAGEVSSSAARAGPSSPGR